MNISEKLENFHDAPTEVLLYWWQKFPLFFLQMLNDEVLMLTLDEADIMKAIKIIEEVLDVSNNGRSLTPLLCAEMIQFILMVNKQG